MSPNHVCPSCGATLEENVGSACPYCGSALSAPTLISTPAKKKKAAQSSAESLDEVKKLVREGDAAGAAEVASAAFDLTPEAAQTVVEQTALEIKPAVASDPEPEVIVEPAGNASPGTGQPKSFGGRWAIAIGAGGTILLCSCCCCLPLVLAFLSLMGKR
jgi:uncharacterized Zn finger protein (UPF0148 family)